ncbi:MAG: DNA-processing protein DprA [Treponemataceae bacterium]|nr:DNA-processing protein DprA [Treponemataceae bacterium]
MRCTQNDELVLRAAVARLSFLTHGERLSLLKKLDNVSALALLSIDDLCGIVSRKIKKKIPSMSEIVLRAERDVLVMEQYGISMLLPGDSLYPEKLYEISQSPFALYCRGCPEILSSESIGVVGTRHPDGEGLKAAFTFSRDCASHGMTVVSGLAFGIDSAAHKGALAADCGRTIAVLGCGIDTIYPAANKSLAAEIIRSSGCIVSEYPPEEPVRKWQFPERNRIISGLSCATMVIQAPEKSGALITADFALEQGRDLCVHPAAISFAERQRASVKKTGGSKSVKEVSDVFSCPSGVLRLVEEGAPVISSFQEAKELVSGRIYQGQLDLLPPDEKN